MPGAAAIAEDIFMKPVYSIPNMLACNNCYGTAKLINKTYRTISIKGLPLEVHNVPTYVCDRCGDGFHSAATVIKLKKIRRLFAGTVDFEIL